MSGFAKLQWVSNVVKENGKFTGQDQILVVHTNATSCASRFLYTSLLRLLRSSSNGCVKVAVRTTTGKGTGVIAVVLGPLVVLDPPVVDPAGLVYKSLTTKVKHWWEQSTAQISFGGN